MSSEDEVRQVPSSPRLSFVVVVVAVIYAGLTVIMTWPIAGRLGEAIPGSAGDAWVHWFAFRAIRDSLAAGQWPPFTNLIFYPQGVSLIYHNLAYFHAILWIPLQALIGEAQAYSILFMGTFLLNGLATFQLARDETKSNAAAFLAGLVVAFWPYILGHHHHPNLNLIAWVPLSLLFLRRTLRRGRISDALITAVFIALIGIARWQMLVLGGILIGFYYLYYLATHREARTRRILGLTLIIGIVALLIMLPLMWPLLTTQLSSPEDEPFLTPGSKQTDLLAYLVPNRFHPLWGDAVFDRLYGNFDINGLFPATIGYSVLALAIYGAIRQWRKARFWALATLLYLLLALGPELLVNGHTIMPLPYRLVESLFFFRAVRHPDRFNAVLAIPVAMLVAYGYIGLSQWSWLRQKLGRLHPGLLVVLLSALILFEYASEYRMLGLGTPPWYGQLAQEEDDFAILILPVDDIFAAKHFMRDQMIHGKALVGGKIARPPDEAFSFVDSLEFIQNSPGKSGWPADVKDTGQQLRLLADNNVRYIVAHKLYLSEEQMAAWGSWLIVTPIHDDPVMTVYATDYLVGRDTPFQETEVDGLGIVNMTTTPESTSQDGWVEVKVDWATNAHVEEEVVICTDVVDEQGRAFPGECRPLSNGDLAANEMFHATYPIHMDPFLESGAYDIRLSLAPVGQSIVAGSVAFNAFPRNIVPASQEMAEDSPIWANTLALVDHDVSQVEGGLQIDLEWLALSRMDTSYKVFVHLFEEDTGVLVGQLDTAPRDWRYPTNWWEEGELVDDSLFLPLEGELTGEHTLWIGVYDVADGQRPPLVVPSGASDQVREDAYQLLRLSP